MIGALRRAPLYLRTLRTLRPEQWLFLPLRRLQGNGKPRRVPCVPRSARTAPALARAVEQWGEGSDPARIEGARDIVAGRFHFLNHSEDFSGSGPGVEPFARLDWGRRHVNPLWNFNLHYFDYAPDLVRAFRRTGEEAFLRTFERLATGWVAQTATGAGDGWRPYPISLRVVNWIEALLLAGEALRVETREVLTSSLAAQAFALERRLEWHLGANHLQKNFYALAVAGMFFDGPDAARWRRKGLRGLWRALGEQVLADGGHVERSPMYHAIALQDFLRAHDLCAAAGEPVPPAARERTRRMVRALGILSRPDGRLHLFNDSADGIAPPPGELDALSARVLGETIPEPSGVVSLPETGYFGFIDAARQERILIDCGAPGAEYQPGHAHCDLLSFELDVGGVPFVVDSGVSGYDGDCLREYARSTRAHNTVMIRGREQSEVWATFRLARRAVAVEAEIGTPSSGGWIFRGAYHPYHAPRAVHARTVQGSPGRWTITDTVDGAGGGSLFSFLHIHPDWSVEPEESGFVARAGEIEVRLRPFGVKSVELLAGEESPQQGWYCPEFGLRIPAPTLRMQIAQDEAHAFGYVIEVT